jgi:hypothetical protein
MLELWKEMTGVVSQFSDLQTNACKDCSDFKHPRETRNAGNNSNVYSTTLRFYRRGSKRQEIQRFKLVKEVS